MSVKVENLEHNMVKLTVTVPADDFSKALTQAYNRNKKNISIPGFRKGHAPQQLIEKMYGTGVFYEDAANILIPQTYPDEAESTGLEIVSRPEFDIEQIEKGKDFIYTATAAVKPAVELGAYEGIEVKKQDVTVTDEDVDAAIKKEQEKNSRLVDAAEDAAVENGDTVNLDYSGSVDGVKFDGGTAEGQTLVIGSNTFIPGFEDQLVGMKAGEEKDVNVTFPAEYHAKDLAGKDAVFACKINKIQKKELPELNDEFAQDVSEFDTMDEYRESVKSNLVSDKEKAAKNAKTNEAVDKLIESSKMDIPDAMVASQAEQMYEDFARRLQSQGIPIDMYLQYQGSTEAKFKEDIKPQALKQIQERLVLEAVAEKADIKISDEDFDAEVKKIADQYKMDVDKLKESMSDYEKDQLKKDMAVQKAVELVTDSAKEV
ncbi:MAG: trigger factor [Lachnospiraceae bacterium]|jgi:trigger factor|nr:trigger factor [Lachnospiraceae bacterium]MCH4063070.1 trigger factor [Lachnospiraceae bacterium]MCH4104378.1 trigger factor [Lachnospiraceae bacterium]MCI1310207.1 trigger factor [Lachnospiraceae bacterium]MCI1334692.1 trigger factor [Lachnospiraceae bacterium]